MAPPLFQPRSAGLVLGAVLCSCSSQRYSTPQLEGIEPGWLAYLTTAHNVSGTAHGPKGESDLLHHLSSVHHAMVTIFDGGPALRAASLFHSLYGTEGFQGNSLPFEKAAELRELIGAEAELLVFANCVMDRASLDELVKQLHHRAGSPDGAAPVPAGQRYSLRTRSELHQFDQVPEALQLSEAELLDLLRVHLADYLDLVESYDFWFYRRDVYRQIAQVLGGAYLDEHTAVLARQPADATEENSVVPEMVKARQLGVFDKVQSGEMSYEDVQGLQGEAAAKAQKLKVEL